MAEQFLNLSGHTIAIENILWIDWQDSDDDDHQPGATIYFAASAGNGVFNSSLFLFRDEPDYWALLTHFGRV